MNGGRACLARCERIGDCRAGFACVGASRLSGYGVLGACQPRRPTDALADDVAGGACERDADCGGGRCESENPLGARYPGNACTGRCYDDAACGRGGVCLLVTGTGDPGHCLKACEGEADCPRPGYRCRELSLETGLTHGCFPGAEPLPDGVAGRACAGDAECDGGVCAPTLPQFGTFGLEEPQAPGGYCTQACAMDADCGSGAQCITRGRVGGLCLAGCDAATPCREGYACLAHLRDQDPSARVCVVDVAAPAGD